MRGVDSGGDDAVLEREARGGDAVVLDPGPCDADHSREPRRLDEWCEASVERERRLPLEWQPLAIPPHRRRARGDRRAIGERSLRRINGIEWPEAVLAYRDRRPLLLRPAHPTPLRQDAEALVLYRGHADEVNRRSL